MVEEEGGERYVKRIVIIAQVKRIARFDRDAPPHALREMLVEVAPRIVHRARVQVDPDRLDPAALRMPEVDQVDQAVAAARPDVQDAKAGIFRHEGSEHAPGGYIPAQEPVRPAQVAQRFVQPVIGYRHVVHDLIDMDAFSEVRKEC